MSHALLITICKYQVLLSCCNGNIKSREQKTVIPNYCQIKFEKSHEMWWR